MGLIEHVGYRPCRDWYRHWCRDYWHQLRYLGDSTGSCGRVAILHVRHEKVDLDADATGLVVGRVAIAVHWCKSALDRNKKPRQTDSYWVDPFRSRKHGHTGKWERRESTRV